MKKFISFLLFACFAFAVSTVSAHPAKDAKHQIHFAVQDAQGQHCFVIGYDYGAPSIAVVNADFCPTVYRGLIGELVVVCAESVPADISGIDRCNSPPFRLHS